MQFTNKMTWSQFDFNIAGVLIHTIGFLYELVLQKAPKMKHIMVICLMLLLLFFWFGLNKQLVFLEHHFW